MDSSASLLRTGEAMSEYWNCVCITLTQGKHTIIDADDFPLVGQYKWHAHNSRGKWYANRAEYVDGKQVRFGMHQLILNIRGRQVVGDHINGDTLDNRWQNIRKTTIQGNNINARIRSDNKTGYL